MGTFDRRSLILGTAATAAALATPFARGAASGERALPPPLAVKTRNVSGRILYIDEDDRERGREWFQFSHRPDGEVTCRVYCEIDDAQVERDVVQTMKSNFAPLDCFVRLHVEGKFLGTGWIRVTDKEAECEVFNTQLGRVSQRMPLAVPATSLVSHPIITDGLLMAGFDHGRAEKTQYTTGGLSTSPLLDGSSGPFISVGGRRGIEYVGQERVRVRAGTFDTHHYRMLMGPKPDGSPRGYDLWCLHPGYIVVKAEVRGYLRNKTGFGRYELVEYEA